MRNRWSANLFHLRKSGLFRGLLLLNSAFGMFYTSMHAAVQRQTGHHFPLSMDLFVFPLLLGFEMAVFIPLFFGAEYSGGIIRNKVASGCPRMAVYLAHLAASMAAALAAGTAYLVPVLVIGIPVFSPLPMDMNFFLLLLLGALALVAGYCALYTAATMNCGRKSTAAAACLAEMLGVYLLTGGIENHLMQPESTPFYVGGPARTVLEIIYNLSPVGQSFQYMRLETDNPVQLTVYSLGTCAAATAAGLALFQRKDLK